MVAFGVHVGLEAASIGEVRQVWNLAEDLGFDWVSVWDHFAPTMNEPISGAFEAVACHAALAATTQRVRVGSLVYSAGYRHPAVLANAATTIDHLSNGRLELGIGAGWFEPEYRAYGFEFEPPAVRLRRLREYVQVIRALWRETSVDFHGEFFELTAARCDPKPIQQLPRIWVGAPGEVRGIRIAAEVADGWNCAAVSPEAFARKRQILMDAAPDPGAMLSSVSLGLLDGEGDPDQLVVDRFGPEAAALVGGVDAMLVGSTQRVTARVGEYVEAGADWVILRLVAPFGLDALAKFADEVAPAFA